MDNNLISIPIKSREVFFFFVRECNNLYRFSHDLNYYREIIEMHRNYKNIEDILNNEDFLLLIHRTLEKWNMNMKGAKLNNVDEIKNTISLNKKLLGSLYEYKINEIDSLSDEKGKKILMQLKLLFKNLHIMKSKRRIVGVSKTMHFLLPDLVLPIDGKYTMTCFYGYNKYSDNAQSEAETFADIFIKSHKIVKSLKLSDEDVDSDKWNTSIPKLIDNAMIGFLRYIEKYGSKATLDKIKEL